jgi:Dockerin type I domain
VPAAAAEGDTRFFCTPHCSLGMDGIITVEIPIAPEDLNGDGFVNGLDLAVLLAAWGRCPAPPATCPADLNASGTVNGLDLAQLLAAWNPA